LGQLGLWTRPRSKKRKNQGQGKTEYKIRGKTRRILSQRSKKKLYRKWFALPLRQAVKKTSIKRDGRRFKKGSSPVEPKWKNDEKSMENLRVTNKRGYPVALRGPCKTGGRRSSRGTQCTGTREGG